MQRLRNRKIKRCCDYSPEFAFEETCLVPRPSMIPKDSRYEIGKQSANVGEKRQGAEGGDNAKLLILLVELRGIEPLTS